MKEMFLAGVFALASTAAIFALPATAFAADVSGQVALCAAAADAEGIAAADAYRAKFLKSKGGAVTTVTIKLVPIADDAGTITAECRIKRGEVIDVAAKA